MPPHLLFPRTSCYVPKTNDHLVECEKEYCPVQSLSLPQMPSDWVQIGKVFKGIKIHGMAAILLWTHDALLSQGISLLWPEMMMASSGECGGGMSSSRRWIATHPCEEHPSPSSSTCTRHSAQSRIMLVLTSVAANWHPSTRHSHPIPSPLLSSIQIKQHASHSFTLQIDDLSCV